MSTLVLAVVLLLISIAIATRVMVWLCDQPEKAVKR
jgi:hypothetical protein